MSTPFPSHASSGGGKARDLRWCGRRVGLLLYVDLEPSFHIYDDALLVLCLDDAAYEVGLDGVLAVASVNEDDELNGPGTARVDDGVEGGARRAPGEEDVVDENHVAVGEVLLDRGLIAGRCFVRAVVAVGRYGKSMDGEALSFDAVHPGGKHFGERRAAPFYSADLEAFRSPVALEHFVGEAAYRALHALGGHDQRSGHVNPGSVAKGGSLHERAYPQKLRCPHGFCQTADAFGRRFVLLKHRLDAAPGAAEREARTSSSGEQHLTSAVLEDDLKPVFRSHATALGLLFT